MSHLKFKFNVLDVEYIDATVATPQIVVFNMGINEVRVVVYFMANTAVSITGGVANSAMGKVTLQYLSESPSSAYTASVNLRKIEYIFYEAQGMARNFVFKGLKET